MQIIRTFDKNLIKKILLSENLYKEFSDDSFPESLVHFEPKVDSQYYWIIPAKEYICGVILFRQLGGILADSHAALFRKYRGEGSELIGKAAINWMRKNTSISKFITFVPDEKEAALKYAIKCGFKETAKIKESIVLNGRLMGHTILEVN